MTSKVTLTLQADDAEPFLLAAAEDAAKFGAWCDYITTKTHNSPSWGGLPLAERKKEWLAKFLRAKRIVESFGVEYEQTTEAETLTVSYDYVGGKTRVMNLGPLGPVGWRTGSVPDYKHPRPSYYGGVHAEACRQAADRVVRRWRSTIVEESKAA